MRIRILPILLLAAATGVVASQTDQITFKDKAGNMVLRNFKSFGTTFTRQGLKFKGVGSPLSGSWTTQGLSFTADSMSGFASKKSDGSYLLDSATLSGGVTTKLTRKPTGLVTAKSSSAEFTSNSSQSRLDLKGDITLTDEDAGQTTTATGSSGYVILPPQGTTGDFRSAVLEGPVKVFLKRVENGKETLITVTGGKVEMNNTASPPTVTITTDVHAFGNDPVFEGDVRGNRVVITLDSTGQAQSVEITGEPSMTTIKNLQPKKGGGRKTA